MSKYFNWTTSLKRFIRFDAARAEDVNGALDELTAGLDDLDVDVDRSIKLPVGTADQTLAMAAGQRANLLLSFDASGNITAIAGGGRYRGDWATGTAYVTSDYFRDPSSKNIYSVVSAHTSGALATDIAAGLVQLAINVADVEAAKVEAAASAAAATTQAANASSSAGAASASAATATAQAAAASTSATNAASSATAAAASATAAAGSAASASGSAATATAKAAEAAASAASIADGPVASVNGKTGIVTLTATDVGAGDVTLTGTQTLTNKTVEAGVFTNGYTEEVFDLTGTAPALNPANGSIQTWTLSGAATPTDSLTSGQSLILGITAGANTITWPSVTWVKVGGSGTAPTLTSSGVNWVILWKVGTTLRGAFLGTA